MRALVVVESMFGNTEMIGEAVAEGLATRFDVSLLAVAAAPSALPDDVELLVLGGPTHAFDMSRPATRQAAGQQGGLPAAAVDGGQREWLERASEPTSHVAAAAFDTRVKRRGVPGSAARKAEKRLRRLGFTVVSHAATFWVADIPGPLLEGERARARAWGEEVATMAAHDLATNHTHRPRQA